MQFHGLAQIPGYFIEGSAMRHDWNLEALRDVAGLFAWADDSFDCALEYHQLLATRQKPRI